MKYKHSKEFELKKLNKTKHMIEEFSYYIKEKELNPIGCCLSCGEKFTDKYPSNKKFCSQSCRYWYSRNKILNKSKEKYSKNKIINHKPIERECKNCGKLFNTVSLNNVYCSKECCKEYDRNKYFTFQTEGKSGELLKLRFEILKRDHFQCQYCGRTPKSNKCKLVIDHIIPVNRGGLTETNNLITSCEECNLGKMDILLEERQLNKIIKKNE